MGGWKKEDFQQASFRGIEFDCVTTGGGFKKKLVKHEMPYQDGTQVDDLGLSSPSITLTAVFMNEKYPNYAAFLDALKENGSGELVHPLDGRLKAIPESVDVVRDDRAYLAEVRIVFIRADSATGYVPFFYSFGDGFSGVSLLPMTADAKERGIGDAMAATLATASNALGDALAPFTSGVHNAMAQINAVKGAASGLINQAAAPFKLINSAVTFATGLPGEVLGLFAGAIESVAGAYLAAVNAPAAFTRSLASATADIEAALNGFRPAPQPGEVAQASNATRATVAAALKSAYKAVAASAVVKAAAGELSIDDALEGGTNLNLRSRGAAATAARTRLMTMGEIDAAVADARGAINDAIAAADAAYGPAASPIIDGLQTQALLLQESADAARLRRARLVKHEVQSPTSIWLLAFKLYGSVDQVDRLLLLNNLPDPNFIPTGKELTVYV